MSTEPYMDAGASASPGHAALMSRVDWGPLRVLQGVGAFLFALFATVLVQAALIGAADLDSDGLALRVIGQGLLSLAFVAVAFAYARPLGGRWPRPGSLGLRRFRPSALGWMLVAYVGYWACALAYVLIAGEPKQQDIARDLGAGQGAAETAISGLLIVGVAPIAEEVFFRGFMFAGLRRRLPLWPAAVLAGVVFGLTHAPTGLSAVVPLAILGVILAWLYERTGSLWPPILVHMTNNAIAFAVLTS